MYRFATAQPSYREATAGDVQVASEPLQGAHSCDVAVIGGGYTGPSAALHLARDYSVDVRVLKAGHVGWGASGRNGGFCGIGGTTCSSALPSRGAWIAKASKSCSLEIVDKRHRDYRPGFEVAQVVFKFATLEFECCLKRCET